MPNPFLSDADAAGAIDGAITGLPPVGSEPAILPNILEAGFSAITLISNRTRIPQLHGFHDEAEEMRALVVYAIGRSLR